MFAAKSFSSPQIISLDLGDKVTWWSRRYKTYITGQVVELTRKYNYRYFRKPDGTWDHEGTPVERIYVKPDDTAPEHYPYYRLSFKPFSLSKII